MSQKNLNDGLLPGGRALMSGILIVVGLGKVGRYAGIQAYMASVGVPGELLPLVIALELGAGTALLLGWRARAAALALAGLSVVAALISHANPAEPMQSIPFMKNLAIAGGLLLVVAAGGGAFSLQRRV